MGARRRGRVDRRRKERAAGVSLVTWVTASLALLVTVADTVGVVRRAGSGRDRQPVVLASDPTARLGTALPGGPTSPPGAAAFAAVGGGRPAAPLASCQRRLRALHEERVTLEANLFLWDRDFAVDIGAPNPAAEAEQRPPIAAALAPQPGVVDFQLECHTWACRIAVRERSVAGRTTSVVSEIDRAVAGRIHARSQSYCGGDGSSWHAFPSVPDNPRERYGVVDGDGVVDVNVDMDARALTPRRQRRPTRSWPIGHGHRHALPR